MSQAHSRALGILLRVFGGVTLLATPFVFVPWTWMNAIHEGLLGMGRLPDQPIVGYLARSTSAFYAMMGGLFVLMSFDVQRYRPAIGYLLGVSVAFGVVIFGVDIAEGMPLYWRAAEGPMVVILSALMLWLWRRSSP
jgi:hypothetical protein